MFAAGQVGILFQMFGPQRFGDGVFFIEPFAQVHQLASPRAEGTMRRGKPIAFLAAGRAFDFRIRLHQSGWRIARFSRAGKLNREPPRRRASFNPNSEVGMALPWGSPGQWPGPSGDPPLGIGKAREPFRTSISDTDVLPVPSGQWPDGTGESPVPPVPISEFGFN